MTLLDLTAADVRNAGAGAIGFFHALRDVVDGTATLDDAEEIGGDLLAALAFADPPTAPVVALAKFGLSLYLAAAAAGLVRPGAPGEGQTVASEETHGRFIGR